MMKLPTNPNLHVIERVLLVRMHAGNNRILISASMISSGSVSIPSSQSDWLSIDIIEVVSKA